jgi:hypothetical protein
MGIPRYGVPSAHFIEHTPSVAHTLDARVARQRDGARVRVPADHRHRAASRGG